MPPHQCSDHAQIADGIDPKWCSDAGTGGHEPSQGGTDCSADIHAHTIRRDSRWQMLLWNELRHDRLPSWSRQRAAYANQKCEEQ
jgi:hypothetical protein